MGQSPLHSNSTQLLPTSPRPSPSLNEPVKVSQMPPPPQCQPASQQPASCLSLYFLQCCFLPPPGIAP